MVKKIQHQQHVSVQKQHKVDYNLKQANQVKTILDQYIRKNDIPVDYRDYYIDLRNDYQSNSEITVWYKKEMKYYYYEAVDWKIVTSEMVLSKAASFGKITNITIDADGNKRDVEKSVIPMPKFSEFITIRNLFLYFLGCDKIEPKYTNLSVSFGSLGSRSMLSALYVTSLIISLACGSTNHGVFNDFWLLGSTCKMFQNLLIAESIDQGYFEVLFRLHVIVYSTWNNVVRCLGNNGRFRKDDNHVIEFVDLIFDICQHFIKDIKLSYDSDQPAFDWGIEVESSIDTDKKIYSDASCTELSYIEKDFHTIASKAADIIYFKTDFKCISSIVKGTAKKKEKGFDTLKCLNDLGCMYSVNDRKFMDGCDSIRKFVLSGVWRSGLPIRYEGGGRFNKTIKRSCLIDKFMDNGVYLKENILSLCKDKKDKSVMNFDTEAVQQVVYNVVNCKENFTNINKIRHYHECYLKECRPEVYNKLFGAKQIEIMNKDKPSSEIVDKPLDTLDKPKGMNIKEYLEVLDWNSD